MDRGDGVSVIRKLEFWELAGLLTQQCGLTGLQNVEMDEWYVFPTREFILGEFSDYFEAELRRKGLLEARAESNDCENFALRAMLDAQELHHKTMPGVGIAFGVLKYEIGGIGAGRSWRDRNHWINFGVELFSWEPVLLKLFFYEPQTRREVRGGLTKAEVESCKVRLF